MQAATHDAAFPIIATYIHGELEKIWVSRTSIRIADDAKISTLRAGELAAADVAREYFAEAEHLENAIRDQEERFFALYDQWIAELEQESILAQLVRFSGTRTLALDV